MVKKARFFEDKNCHAKSIPKSSYCMIRTMWRTTRSNSVFIFVLRKMRFFCHGFFEIWTKIFGFGVDGRVGGGAYMGELVR